MSRDDSFQTASNAEVAAIRQLLTRVPLIDGHNDAAWQLRERFGNRLDAVRFVAGTEALTPPMHTDLERLKAGGVGAQFWSVYLSCDEAGPGAVRALLEQIDVVHRVIEAHPQHLEFARTADDIERIHRAGGVASLIGIEGGHSIDGSLAMFGQQPACQLHVEPTTIVRARLGEDPADEPRHRAGAPEPFRQRHSEAGLRRVGRSLERDPDCASLPRGNPVGLAVRHAAGDLSGRDAPTGFDEPT